MFRIKLPKFRFFYPAIAKHDILAVELASNHLKIAHIKAFPSRRELGRVFYRDISGLSDVDISRMVRSCVNELQIKKAEVINIIPSHMVITKNIEVPSTDQKEIREIINLQAGHHTPYSREEIIVDYIEVGVYKRSYTKILLVILTRNMVKRQSDILEKAGLRPGRVMLAAEGFSHFIPKAAKLENNELPLCIANVDASFSDFTVVLKGKTIFVRSIPIGAEHLTADRERAEIRFTEELRRSLEAYQGENIENNPNVFILTGATDGLKGMDLDLSNALRIPVKVVPYFSSVNVAAEILREASLFRKVSFLGVVSPVVTLDEMKVDLIPEETRLRRSLEERGKDLIKTGIYIMTIFVIVVIMLVSKIYFKSTHLKSLERKYGALDEEARRLEKDFLEIGIIRNYLVNRGYSLDVITELHAITPLSIKLEDIRYEAQGKLSIRGTAESMSAVFSFVDSMEKSSLFKDVKTKYTSKRREGTKDLADFEINCSFEKDANR